MQRSCQKTSCSDLVKRPCEENRDLAKRSYRELEQRSYLEISCRDLAWRSLTNTLYRDLVQRLQRLATKDVDEGNLHRTFCTGPSTDILTNGSCTAAFTEILSRRSCTRSSTELRKENLQTLPRYLFVMHLATLFGASCRDDVNV